MTLKELLTIDTSNSAANAEKDRKVEEFEARQREARKQAEFEKVAPARYWDARLENYKELTPTHANARRVVAHFISQCRESKNVTLVLLGPVGTGKTYLSFCALREIGGYYLSASELIDELKQAQAYTSKETEAERLKRYASYNLLVVDEVGRGEKTEAEKYAIYQIINARYNAKKPTILISNFIKPDFISYIGAAANDRIIESGFVFEFKPDTKSYRQLKAEE